MGRAKEDQPESSSLEGCCCGPLLHKESGGISQKVSQDAAWNIGTPVATLPGAWRYRVSAGTGWPGVSILWLGEVERWICNFCLSVAARKIVWADPCLLLGLLLGR